MCVRVFFICVFGDFFVYQRGLKEYFLNNKFIRGWLMIDVNKLRAAANKHNCKIKYLKTVNSEMLYYCKRKDNTIVVIVLNKPNIT